VIHGLIRENKLKKRTPVNEHDVRRPLVVSISEKKVKSYTLVYYTPTLWFRN
jgi:hypothetical protein